MKGRIDPRLLRLYRGFRGHGPDRIVSAHIELPDAVVSVGIVEYIGYRTTERRNGQLFHHDFAPGSRPKLAAGTGHQQLFLIGGRYHFTGRGIVDLDIDGNEIPD